MRHFQGCEQREGGGVKKVKEWHGIYGLRTDMKEKEESHKRERERDEGKRKRWKKGWVVKCFIFCIQ